MSQEILHKETIKVSQTIKQWILSIVLLLNLIYFSLVIYFINIGSLFTKEFRKDEFVAISIIIILSSLFVLLVVFIKEVKIDIYNNRIVLKQKTMKGISLSNKMIKTFKSISRKEYYKLFREDQKRSPLKKIRRKKIKQHYSIGIPNIVIILNSSEKIFVQTNKKASFLYSMNKMLNLRYD